MNIESVTGFKRKISVIPLTPWFKNNLYLWKLVCTFGFEYKLNICS
ncbi:hypothetical protein R2F61_05605 [Mollicutes bacterium LVI A0078]|nr:hypothetical protein R2F61_05605 [Mollicutes bacterium LVI A0078]